MPRLLLANAEVVTPDRVIPGGSVLIEDGVVAGVAARAYRAGGDPAAVDLGGRLLLPGLVDLHNDALELDVSPRPGARFPLDFALIHLDRKLAAAGVTTQFHAVSFSELEHRVGRSLDGAVELCRAVRGLRRGGEALIEHQTLLRLDLRTPGALEAVLGELDAAEEGEVKLLSLNDHVPGRGQYRDFVAYARGVLANRGEDATPEGIAAVVAEGEGRAAKNERLVAETLGRLTGEAARRGVLLVSHDDDSPERVEERYGLGCRIAEFPITLEAAERARARGMAIAMGAANTYRGRSLTGNAAALDLIGRGLVDILVADYSAPALLAALFKVVDLGLADLPAATRLVTANPAAAVGLGDRGAIVAGKRADLIVVERRAGVPLAAAAMVGGEWRAAGGRLAGAAVGGPVP